jgi:hypothetical protein
MSISLGQTVNLNAGRTTLARHPAERHTASVGAARARSVEGLSPSRPRSGYDQDTAASHGHSAPRGAARIGGKHMSGPGFRVRDFPKVTDT